MLKQNKNRGAGLVTVVVVLAVASILLSGAIFLAFNHYRNVINDEIAEEALAEIQLCAEVICAELGSDEFSKEVFFEAFKDGSVIHLYFANLSKSEFQALDTPATFFTIAEDKSGTDDNIVDNKSVSFSGFRIVIDKVVQKEKYSELVATISCEDEGISRSVSFYHYSNSWSLVPPEVNDDEP